VFAYPILGQFDGYTTLSNLEGHEAQAVWAVAIEVLAIPAILGLVLGLAGAAVPLRWRTVGIWAFTAGILGHYFESPLGLDALVVAILVVVVIAVAVSLLGRTSLLDVTRGTWNDLAAGGVIAVLGVTAAPVTSLLDVKDVVALAAVAVIYRLVSQRSDQRTSLVVAVVGAVFLRWLVIGSVGSGDSALFLDTQILATVAIGFLVAGTVRSGSRWFGADIMVITSACMLISSLTYRVASPHADVEGYSHGGGSMVAIVASIVMLVGALLALQTAPYSAFRPLERVVAWGRMGTGILAVALVVIGGFSAWTYDERVNDELPPELVEEMERLRAEAKENPALAATNTSKVTSLRNKFRRNAQTITDGYSDEGAGLSRLAIAVAAIGALLTIPSSGLAGLDENRRWRWSAAVAAAGGGLALIGIVWVASLARVSDLNVVTGAGAFLTMFSGAILAVTSKKILLEFRRNKTYDDVEAAAV
jgi:hypothetical protein